MKTLSSCYNQNSVCEIMDELAKVAKDSVREGVISSGDVNYIYTALISNLAMQTKNLICQALPDWIQAININNWTSHASFWCIWKLLD